MLSDRATARTAAGRLRPSTPALRVGWLALVAWTVYVALHYADTIATGLLDHGFATGWRRWAIEEAINDIGEPAGIALFAMPVAIVLLSRGGYLRRLYDTVAVTFLVVTALAVPAELADQAERAVIYSEPVDAGHVAWQLVSDGLLRGLAGGLLYGLEYGIPFVVALWLADRYWPTTADFVPASLTGDTSAPTGQPDLERERVSEIVDRLRALGQGSTATVEFTDRNSSGGIEPDTAQYQMAADEDLKNAADLIEDLFEAGLLVTNDSRTGDGGQDVTLATDGCGERIEKNQSDRLGRIQREVATANQNASTAAVNMVELGEAPVLPSHLEDVHGALLDTYQVTVEAIDTVEHALDDADDYVHGPTPRQLTSDHADRLREQYDGPVLTVALQLLEYNRRKWLHKRPETNGAEDVERHGLTENQRHWLNDLADAWREHDGDE